MYKKSDFEIDVSEKVELVSKKIDTKIPITNGEEFKKILNDVKNIIANIAVSDLGYSSKLEYTMDYGYIGDTFSTATVYLYGVGETDLKIDCYRECNFLVKSENVYDDIIKNLLNYYERYENGLKIQANLDEFNSVVADIMQENAVQAVRNRLEYQLEEEKIDFDSIVSKTSLSFGLSKDYLGVLGSGVQFLDISELHAVIGLSEEVIMDMGSWGMFDTAYEGRAEATREAFSKILAIYVQPYGLVKVNDPFTKNNYLNIYTRENLHTVMRRSFNTPLSELERGLGYYETKGKDGIFAIIEKKAIKESDMKEPNEDLIYIDNLNMNEEEAKQGLNMIEISFRIFPFYKDTDEPANDTLTEIWNSLKD